MELYIDDRIRNRKVKLFNQYSVSLRYDAIASSFTFAQYFNPNNPEHKEMLCVGHDHLARVEHNGELLMTGYVMDQDFSGSSVRGLTTLAGYSKTGFLEDCNIAPQYHPLQHDGMNLREITQKLIQPFGLSMVIDGGVSALMDQPFDKTTAEVTETIKDYLTKLAAQKGIIISHNAKGNIVFTRANTGAMPILNYGDGGTPLPKMKLSFKGGGMHSHIYVLKQADKDGGNAGQSDIRNPYVPYVFRPKVIVQSSGTDIDTDKAARTALGAELKNLKVVIETDRWEINGKVIKPNSIITVKNPEIYLYNKTRLFVEQVDLRKDEKAETATLTCALPEVFNEDVVKYLFEGINTH